VLLDALGTLVELEPPAPRLREQLRQRFGLSVSETEAHRAIAAEMVYYRAHLNEGRDPVSLTGLRQRCAEVLWAELPGGERAKAPDTELLVEALMSSLSFRAFNDAPGALTALRELGLILIVVSNWDSSLSAVLDRVGLSSRLHGVVTSAQVGARKPQRAMFERALELAGTSADEAVHVGDNLTEDVEGARAAGIEAVLVAREEAGPSETFQIRSLSELPALLRPQSGSPARGRV
jgi:putative hydrolase of the HAD superfamily